MGGGGGVGVGRGGGGGEGRMPERAPARRRAAAAAEACSWGGVTGVCGSSAWGKGAMGFGESDLPPTEREP